MPHGLAIANVYGAGTYKTAGYGGSHCPVTCGLCRSTALYNIARPSPSAEMIWTKRKDNRTHFAPFLNQTEAPGFPNIMDEDLGLVLGWC